MYKKVSISIVVILYILLQAGTVFSQVSLPEENLQEGGTPIEVVMPEETPPDQNETEPETQLEDEEEPIFDDEGPSEEMSTIMVRVGERILFQGTVALPESGSKEIIDSIGAVHTISTRSILGILTDLDTQEESFSISKLVYYDSFGSFYLQCLTTLDQEEFCDDWQYTVNTTTPWQSIDQLTVQNNDMVGIYFGKSFRLTFSPNESTINTPIIVTAEKYLYETDTWIPRSGVTVGATLPNAENLWEPVIVFEHVADESGHTSFSFSAPNTYALGVKEDYYYPLFSVLIKQLDEENNTSEGDGGENIPESNFDVAQAIAYLKNIQSDDGSFARSKMISDWVAVAFGAENVSGDAKNKLLAFMKDTNTTSSLVTDNARRAIAILALDENPYDFFGVNYVSPILDAFDGKQIGSPDLVNDDLFALLVLSHVGYKKGEDILDQSIQFIISKQKLNGSWENSIDMTAAAIQTLKPFDSQNSVARALNLAEGYVKSMQEIDGGWGNVYTTSWALQASRTLGISWMKDGKDGVVYLAQAQREDGAVLSQIETEQNRIWATGYAIPAVLGKTWDSLLENVSKPVFENIRADDETQQIEEILPVAKNVPTGSTAPDNSVVNVSQPEKVISSVIKKNETVIVFKEKESGPKQLEYVPLVASAGVFTQYDIKMSHVLVALVLVIGSIFFYSKKRIPS